MSKKFAVVAIGNAVVDVIASATDDFIAAEGLRKGDMTLIDAARATELYDHMGPAREVSGGSAANTIAGMAALGQPCGFIGQVADDQLGAVFAHDIRALGVKFDTAPMADAEPTGRCLILVTPDGQRTMNTFLGAAQHLPEAALDAALIRDGALLYLEGYLWNAPASRDAMRQAIDIAKQSGARVALTLSAMFVVEAHRDEFFQLLDEGAIDLIFANNEEITLMTGIADPYAAAEALAKRVPELVCTHGAAGAEAYLAGEHARVSAEPGVKVVDTTGAGDLFAAGYLAGRAEGRSLEHALTMGAVCAAEVISHFGPRPEADLKALVATRLD